jgi:hypothetical protein
VDLKVITIEEQAFYELVNNVALESSTGDIPSLPPSFPI